MVFGFGYWEDPHPPSPSPPKKNWEKIQNNPFFFLEGVPRVGWAQRIVVVQAANRPLPVRNPLPLKLGPQVEKGPASVLGQVAFAPVLEAVEVGDCNGPGQVDKLDELGEWMN